METNMRKIRCRVAPSPTGKLHLGTAHTSLFNYLFAKHNNGEFILRIDDSDKERSKKEFEKDISGSLRWLGITWDEGPDIGGPYIYYRQSERGAIYKKYLDRLLKEDKAYYCYCSREELEEARKSMESKKIAPKYSGKCRNLTEIERRRIESKGQRGTIRLLNPNKNVTFIDLVRGRISVDTSLFGDFVIARSDGSALLNFAATVDDIDMKITHAIRGEDFINMVPRQLLIFEALGIKPPEFAHLSFLYASDKTKLSKRHGATAVSEYREMGYLPEAMVNYLGILGYSMSDEREFFTLLELINDFEMKRVQKGAPIFNLDKLNWYNGYYIRKSQKSKVKSQIYEYLKKEYPEDLIGKTIPLIQERIKKLSDYLPLCEFFFKKPVNYEIDLSGKSNLFKKIYEKLASIKDWKAEIIGKELQDLCNDHRIKTGEFFMILRVAITGKTISPPLNESMEILGSIEVLSRIRKIINP
ncbi:glutamate--tRNA ligase [Candidatus Gottesmanbacteria bacterium]|nr:glutamate--tRNA ligase [Candidatus Gottesmanbacteria bacterium]